MFDVEIATDCCPAQLLESLLDCRGAVPPLHVVLCGREELEFGISAR